MEDTNKILSATQLLKKGDVVAFPTETVYGLGASVYSEEALKKIFSLKGRPTDNPLIVHIHSLDQVSLLAINIPEDFYHLAKAFFPGPLTIILQKNASISSLVTAGLDTIGIRMPRHPLALELLKAINEPVAAPSANLSGKPSPTCYEHVVNDFSNKIPLVLNGGECEVGIESTVISLVREPTILRPGTITQSDLEKVLKKPVKLLQKGKKILCPGMKYRHYAPLAKITTFNDKKELCSKLNKISGERVWILTNRGLDTDQFPMYPYNCKNLYKIFRDSDDGKIDRIFILVGEEEEKDLGLLNRIEKAKIAK